jgi:hypothetical protein
MYKQVLHKSPLIIIEGKRLVGKSFLINSVKNTFDVYKYPFVEWNKNIKINGLDKDFDPAIFYLLFGHDTVILDLKEKGLLNNKLIQDRGFLSNAVFGIQSKRISKEEVIINSKWLLSKWSESFKIVYINADSRPDNRDKDEWNIYDPIETDRIYLELMSELKIPYISFFNNFDKKSELDFFEVLRKI